MLNQKQFAELKQVPRSTVKNWYEKKYLFKATHDKNGVYSIPEDTPTPYHGKNLDKVTKISTLMQKLLEAADSCQSVFPSMFPKVNENDFNATLKELVDNGCIEIVETKYGKHLRILTKGIDLCKTLDTEPKAKTAFCNVLGTVFKTFIPVVLEYVFSNPEWWNSIVQHFS